MGQRPDRGREHLFIISRAKCEFTPNSKVYAHAGSRTFTARTLQPAPPACSPASLSTRLQRINHPKLLLHLAHRSVEQIRRGRIRRPLRFAKRPHQRAARSATRLDAHLQRSLRRLVDRPRARTRSGPQVHRKGCARIRPFRTRTFQLSQPPNDPRSRVDEKRNQFLRVLPVRRPRRKVGAQRFFPGAELIVRRQQLPDHAILAADRQGGAHAAGSIPLTFKPPPTPPLARAALEPASSPPATPPRPDSKSFRFQRAEKHATRPTPAPRSAHARTTRCDLPPPSPTRASRPPA